MFGLREEVIGGLMLLALLIIGGATLYVRHVLDENTDLEVRVAHATNVIEGHKRTESALKRDAATKEAANVEHARTNRRLNSALAAATSRWETLRRENAEYRSWADTPLPADVRNRRLRAPAAPVQP